MSLASRSRFFAPILAALLAAAPAAFSATVVPRVEVETFSRDAAPSAKAAKATFQTPFAGGRLISEGFDGFATWDGAAAARGSTDLGGTAVGSFRAYGTAGSGRSKVGDGRKLQVRADSDMAWGRYDTDLPVDGHWLDSNDNTGIEWTISGLGRFDALSFFVLDAADVGGWFSMTIGDTVFDIAGQSGRTANGNILFVKVLLDTLVDTLTVRLGHDRANDGFGLDGATVARLPATSAAETTRRR